MLLMQIVVLAVKAVCFNSIQQLAKDLLYTHNKYLEEEKTI